MTTYLGGLEYDAALDTLAHAVSNVTPGVYSNPSLLQLDEFGHVVDIETGEVGSGYIEGLGLEYAGVNSVKLQPGAAFVAGLNRVVTMDSEQTIPIPTTTNGLFYIYFREVNGAGYATAETVGPAAPYFGSARVMTGFTNTRYLGIVRNDASGNVMPFVDLVAGGSLIERMYTMGLENTTLRFLSDYATAARNSKQIGPTATLAVDRLVGPAAYTVYLLVQSYATTGGPAAYIGYFTTGQTFPSHSVPASGSAAIYYPWSALGPNQEIWYHAISTNNRLSAFVAGYKERR